MTRIVRDCRVASRKRPTAERRDWLVAVADGLPVTGHRPRDRNIVKVLPVFVPEVAEVRGAEVWAEPEVRAQPTGSSSPERPVG